MPKKRKKHKGWLSPETLKNWGPKGKLIKRPKKPAFRDAFGRFSQNYNLILDRIVGGLLSNLTIEQESARVEVTRTFHDYTLEFAGEWTFDLIPAISEIIFAEIQSYKKQCVIKVKVGFQRDGEELVVMGWRMASTNTTIDGAFSQLEGNVNQWVLGSSSYNVLLGIAVRLYIRG